MAAFRQHVTFSTVLGLGYAAALKGLGWDAGQAMLAGGLCGLAGMLPDLDSDSGKPIKELFGLLATVASLFVFHRLRHTDLEPAERILVAKIHRREALVVSHQDARGCTILCDEHRSNWFDGQKEQETRS